MQRRVRGFIAKAALALIGFAGAGSAPAAITDITFESDPLGIVGNGWASADSTFVRFAASPGGDLQILPEVGSNEFMGTRGLAVFGTPDVSLILRFAFQADSLQLAFGNDDPSSTVAGDQAILVAFLGDAQVAQSSVPLNRNDVMDQTIQVSGTPFDRAVFFYTADRFLAETVDNLRVSLNEGAPVAVPEPESAMLLALGLVLLASRTLARRDRNGRTKR